MTTIAVNNGIMAADSQATLGNLIVNEDIDKVARFDSDEHGSVYVAFAGAINHISEAIQFIEEIFEGGVPEAVKFDGAQMQMLMLCEDGTLFEGELTEASTSISWVICETPYAIGSGAHLAIGAMDAGLNPVEAIKVASRRCAFTNQNVKEYKVEELDYVHLLDARIKILNDEKDMLKQLKEEQGTGDTPEPPEKSCKGDCEGCECVTITPDQDTVEDVTEALVEEMDKADGYIKNPGNCPVGLNTVVSVIFRNGDKDEDYAGSYDWRTGDDYPMDEDAGYCISSYKVNSEES